MIGPISNTDLALFLLRIIAGITFLYHGWPKLANFRGTVAWLGKEKFPVPFLAAAGVSIVETFGGVFLLLGILVQPVGILLALNMLVATIYDLRKGQGWKPAEHAATLFVIALVLVLAGGGAWSVLA